MKNNVIQQDEIPHFDLTKLPGEEAERRRAILADIGRQVAENGKRTAMPDPRRAQQFMPFAALEGFTELVKEEERKSASRKDG